MPASPPAAADVPIYPTLPARQAEYILRDSGAVAVFVSTAASWRRCGSVRDAAAGACAHVIGLDPETAGPGVLSFDAVLARGRAARDRHPDWHDSSTRTRRRTISRR